MLNLQKTMASFRWGQLVPSPSRALPPLLRFHCKVYLKPIQPTLTPHKILTPHIPFPKCVEHPLPMPHGVNASKVGISSIACKAPKLMKLPVLLIIKPVSKHVQLLIQTEGK